MKCLTMLTIQVFLCISLVSAKLHIIESLKSEDIFNHTENTLNDTLDNDNNAGTSDADDDDNDVGDDLITSSEEPQNKDFDVVLVAPTLSSKDSASPTVTDHHKAAWPFTNQRPLRQQVAEAEGEAATASQQSLNSHHRLPAAAFKSNNEHLKLNKLKAFSKAVPLAEDGGVPGVEGLGQQSFESNTKNVLRNRPKVAGVATVATALHHDIEANNDNNQKPQQVNHLQFYTTNSVPPLSFGQLPQFLRQQQQLPLAAASLPPPLPQVFSYSYHQYNHHHQFADYRLLFNAERHTEFYLYTRTKALDDNTLKIPGPRIMMTTTTNAPPTTATTETTAATHDGGRVLHVVSDTIGAAFGVKARPVAGRDGIRLEQLELYDARSLRQSSFNPFNPTRILIHGWLGGSTAGLYNTLIPEYLGQQNVNYNVITVDWGKGAISDYITASYRVKPVGKVLAKFIDFLHRESGLQFENVQVIGFSMGAHVAGIAGKHVQTGRLPIIYALDPALPLFRYETVAERVDTSDADYVEVVHTSVGSYGYDRPLGHVDFFVNYGSSQPGCYFNECSHFRAFQIFAQSLRGEVLEGIGCSAQMWPEMIKLKKCPKETGSKLSMTAGSLNRTTLANRRGVYYVLTNAHPPI